MKQIFLCLSLAGLLLNGLYAQTTDPSLLNFGLGSLPYLMNAETRMVSPENPTGERGSGGMAIPDTIQALGWYNGRSGGYRPLADDVASVAYWYQTEPHNTFPKLIELKDRWPR